MKRSIPTSLGVLAAVVALFASSLQAASGRSGGDGPGRPGRIDARDRRPSESSLDEAAATASGDAGSARVIAGLRIDFAPEGRMSAASRSNQRRAIAAGQQAVRDDLARTNYHVTNAYTTVPYIGLSLDRNAVEALRRSDAVASVVIDRPVRPTLAESVPLIGATTLFDGGFTGAGQTVAILDTGVDLNHPFLGNRVVEEACFSDTRGFPGATPVCPNGQSTQTGPGSGINCNVAIDGCEHGTHVTGIAAGNGATFSGVAKGASIMAVQVFSRFDSPSDCSPQAAPCALSFPSNQLAAFERVLAVGSSRPVSSVNLSLGGERFFASCDDEPLKAGIDNLLSAGIATVIASGNQGFSDSVNTPGCISTAVTVGSTTKDDQVSFFSNGHPTLVDLLAPGSAINSSVPGGGFAVEDGTSMATPHVTGAFALLRSRFPTATIDQILSALKTTGLAVTDPAGNPPFTTPRIRVGDAAALLAGGGGTAFTVSFSAVGPGAIVGQGINCAAGGTAADCSEAYAAGTQPSFTASRFRKAKFKGWGGDFGACGRLPVCTIMGIQRDFSASASFNKKKKRR
jgi:subtilisin family serine protease